MLTSRQCPDCGAKLPITPAGAVVTCRYCGTELEVKTGDRTLDEGRTSAARSDDTRAPVTITFVNTSGRALQLVWLDFAGNEVSYGQVEAGGEQRFDTYVQHVWSVRAGDGAEVLRWAAYDQVPRRVRVG
jgi:hypothetical protein